MVTIKFLGGTKKSFPTEKLEIEEFDITLSVLIDKILTLKSPTTPELDFNNILIAINGVDSSALQGKSTIVKKNDLISIIPIIHGGSIKKISTIILKKNIQIIEIKGSKNINESFLDELRKKFTKVKLQAISSNFILNKQHLQKIIFLSIYSEQNNVMLTNKLETEILVRFALTTQISDAINLVGINCQKNFILICIGPKQSLNKLFHELKSQSVEIFSKNRTNFIKKQFNISNKQLNTIHSDDPLTDILVEKASVLF